MANESMWARVGVGLATLWFGFSAADAATNVQYRVLVRDGAPVPGVPGAAYHDFSAAVLNNRGEIFFGTRAVGSVALSNDYVLVAGGPDSWQYVARESEHVPGLPPGVYLKPYVVPFDNLRFNGAGYLAFASRLAGAGVNSSNDTCFVWGKPGDIRVIAREGDPAPDTVNGETFDDLGMLGGLKLVIGSSNDVAFVARWRGPTSMTVNAGIWLGPATNLSLVARDGYAAPGFGGATWQNLQFTTAQLNTAGKLTFDGGTTKFPFGYAIWAGTTNGLDAVWKSGDPAPGTGTTFIAFSDVTVNTNNEYCFVATLSDAMGYRDSAILSGPETNLRVVAREGYQAPGFETGVVFQSVSLVEPILSAGGHVAFAATVEGPGIGTTNGTAIWSGLPGALRSVCRRGDQAVDLSTGTVYSTSYAATFDLVGLNADGKIAFQTLLEGEGITLGNNQGLWAGVPNFESLLLQRADSIDLGDGEPHNVHMMHLVDACGELQYGGGQDGRARSLNDQDQYAVAICFDAGQGSAIVMIEDVTDADGNGVSRLLECAHGIPPAGPAEHAKLVVRPSAAGLRILHQAAASDERVSLELREADSLFGSWRDSPVVVSNASDQTGVDPGSVRKEGLVPSGGARVRFYRLRAVVN